MREREGWKGWRATTIKLSELDFPGPLEIWETLGGKLVPEGRRPLPGRSEDIWIIRVSGLIDAQKTCALSIIMI